MTAPNAELATITIRKVASDDAALGFDLAVQGEGLESADELTLLLLLVVERATGVSADSYVQLVEECRRIAARESRAGEAS